MSAAAIAKRVKYIFMLCLFSGLCGLGQSIFTFVQAHFFTGIPLFPLLILAEGVIFWQAFRSDSLEKALNQISTLKIIALVLAAYSLYSLVSYYIRIFGHSFDLFMIWFQCVSNFSAFCASLAVFFTAKTLKAGDTKKFNLASGLILLLDVVLVFCVTVAALIVSEYLAPILVGIVLFFLLATVIPKLLGNKIIRGAIIGGIVAGDAGAVVGAIVASKSGDKK